jgi:hypothetical protein
MNKFKFLLAPFLSVLFFSGVAFAQSLPQIQLKQVFPNLKIPPRPDWMPDGIWDIRPLWMCQAPDGSGRFFIVWQTGSISVVKKNSDGSDAKTFLDIGDRHPLFQNEDGLLSIAFHPGFKTNGLFYIYYTQENPADQNLKFPQMTLTRRTPIPNAFFLKSRSHFGITKAASCASAPTVIYILASATVAARTILSAAAKAR